MRPRAPTKLVALGSSHGFSVRSTPTSRDDPTFRRRPSLTSAAAMRFTRASSDVYLPRTAATCASSLASGNFPVAELPASCAAVGRSLRIMSRISDIVGRFAVTTTGWRESERTRASDGVVVDEPAFPASFWPFRPVAAIAATAIIALHPSARVPLLIPRILNEMSCGGPYFYRRDAEANWSFCCDFGLRTLAASGQTAIDDRRLIEDGGPHQESGF